MKVFVQMMVLFLMIGLAQGCGVEGDEEFAGTFDEVQTSDAVMANPDGLLSSSIPSQTDLNRMAQTLLERARSH